MLISKFLFSKCKAGYFPKCAILPTLINRGYRTSKIAFSDSPTNAKDLTHYEVLEVVPEATPREIKNAYLRLSKQFHPDLNPDDKEAALRFQEVSDAFSVLGTPKLRREYDRGKLGRTVSVADRELMTHDFEGSTFVDARVRHKEVFDPDRLKGHRDFNDGNVKRIGSLGFIRSRQKNISSQHQEDQRYYRDRHDNRRRFGSPDERSSGGGGVSGFSIFLCCLVVYSIWKLVS